jgi:GNAT superfamily N-acetyltransferase
MFITRGRHDRSDLEEFFKAHDWEGPHLDKGVGFIARDGGIVGTLRLIEVEPNVVVIEDVLVKEDRRGQGIGVQLMRAAMNSRGGRLFLCCHPERIAFYEAWVSRRPRSRSCLHPHAHFSRPTGPLPIRSRRGTSITS